MSVLEALVILAAGMAAGTINSVVGSGTLITFPVLLAFGYPPVTANVSNTVGLVWGSVAAALGYRRELTGQGPRVRALGVASLVGGVTGAVLLLALPAQLFKDVVPFFIATALVLILLQSRLSAFVARRRAAHHPHGGPAAYAGVGVAGVYGGYFGAAQGILLLATLGITLDDDLHRINALKNVLAALVNGMAGLIFILFAEVDWAVAGLIAAGAIAGGFLGGRHGRRIPVPVLRAMIVVVGVAAIAKLLVD